MRHLLGLYIIVLIAGCQAEEKPPIDSVLQGKIKTLLMNDTSGIPREQYFFYYDSLSGTLNKMIHNNISTGEVDSAIITKIRADVIQIKYYYPTGNLDIYAYVNSQGLVYLISQTFPVSGNPDDIYYEFKYSVNKIDSIYEPHISLPPILSKLDFADYNIEINNDNYSKLITIKYYTDIIGNEYTGADTIELYYNSHSNDINLPLQKIHSNSSFSGWYLDSEIDPVYLLGLSGYHCYKPNKNLIDKIIVVNRFEINYEYVFANNKVSEFRKSTRNTIYKVTYYE